jgi:endo-1,4-beta-mannosidase
MVSNMFLRTPVFHTGYEGVSAECNWSLTNISFATLHVYPDQWNMLPATDPTRGYQWLGLNYIRDRKLLANARNKPIVLEEYGMATSTNYLPNRTTLLTYVQGRANAYDYGGSLVWAVSHFSVDPGNAIPPGSLFGSNDGQGYIFSYEGDGSASVLAQYSYMAQRTVSVG